MIWPNHVSTWLVGLTGAAGQAEGMMILAGMSLWHSMAIGGTVAVGVTLCRTACR